MSYPAPPIQHSQRSIPAGESMAEHVCKVCGGWWIHCDCPEPDEDDDE